MKTMYALFALLMVFLVLSCGEPSKPGTLKIANETMYNLSNVSWNGVSFGVVVLPVVRSVEGGTAPVKFSFFGNTTIYKTVENVTVNGNDVVFTLYDSTMVQIANLQSVTVKRINECISK